MRLWVLGYECRLVPEADARTFPGSHPYEVDREVILHNLLRVRPWSTSAQSASGGSSAAAGPGCTASGVRPACRRQRLAAPPAGPRPLGRTTTSGTAASSTCTGEPRRPVAAFRNIFACLVHERQECAVDLVRNLRALDPGSTILLYNGGRDPDLLRRGFPSNATGRSSAPSQGRWPGAGSTTSAWTESASREHLSFDTLSVVDSEQLASRPATPMHWPDSWPTSALGLITSDPGPSRRLDHPAGRHGLRRAQPRDRLLARFPGGESSSSTGPSGRGRSSAGGRAWTSSTSSMGTAIFARPPDPRIWATEEVILRPGRLARLRGRRDAVRRGLRPLPGPLHAGTGRRGPEAHRRLLDPSRGPKIRGGLPDPGAPFRAAKRPFFARGGPARRATRKGAARNHLGEVCHAPPPGRPRSHGPDRRRVGARGGRCCSRPPRGPWSRSRERTPSSRSGATSGGAPSSWG